MKKKYPEIQDEQQMASEPLATYEVRRDLHAESVVALTSDEKVIREMLSERILRAEAGREPVVSNAEVFDSIRIKYGF